MSLTIWIKILPGETFSEVHVGISETIMRAMLFKLFQKTPEIVTVDDPTPTAGGGWSKWGPQGYVEVTGMARWGTDPVIQLPHVLDHEFPGEIVAVGDGTSGFKVGGRVTVPFVSGRGRCSEYKSGNQQVCQLSFTPALPTRVLLPNWCR